MKKISKKRIKVKGGPLFALSALLVGSAIVRVGMEAGPALAREATAAAQIDETKTKEDTSKQSNIQSLLEILKKREEAVKRREMKLTERMKALDISDKAIEAKLAALIDAEEKLRSTLALADGAAEKDLSNLTSVYEKMKPKEAAKLFEEMEPKFAAGFLGRMRPDSAANIMASLPPQAAYSISVILAGRNALVPKE
ncbi:MAG: MotE family protein [Sedimentitalea sp.]